MIPPKSASRRFCRILVSAAFLPLAVSAESPPSSFTCSASEHVGPSRASGHALTQIYVSRFAGIMLCAPATWSIEIEDETIFIAPSEAGLFWENVADSEKTYYAIGRISTDRASTGAGQRRDDSVLEIARSTAGSLIISEHLKLVRLRRMEFVNGSEGASLLMTAKQRFHYQLILRLKSGRIVTVSAHGRRQDQGRSSVLVDAIARTIRPLPDEAH